MAGDYGGKGNNHDTMRSIPACYKTLWGKEYLGTGHGKSRLLVSPFFAASACARCCAEEQIVISSRSNKQKNGLRSSCNIWKENMHRKRVKKGLTEDHLPLNHRGVQSAL